MRFWKGSAYLVVEFDGYERRFDQIDADGRRLALDFETKSTRSQQPNQGVFALYNLSASSRQEIERNAKAVRCYAGYDGDEKLIFQGDVVFVNSTKPAPDWMTTIHAGDGFKAFTEKVTSKTYASGTEKEIIINQLAADMGLVVKAAKDAVTGALSGDLSLDGRSKDQLDIITKDSGAEWSIQDNEIYITKAEKPIDDIAIVLRADTGLLEHPALTDKGVNIRAQLNPDIRPGKLVKLELIAVEVQPTQTASDTEAPKRGQDYEGVYLCQTVGFVGNNYGGPFDVNIEAVRYDG